jgi:hypothetical protein
LSAVFSIAKGFEFVLRRVGFVSFRQIEALLGFTITLSSASPRFILTIADYSAADSGDFVQLVAINKVVPRVGGAFIE